MSYYRDPLNPEAVHFPAQMHIVATDVLISLALVVCMILTKIYGHGMDALVDASVAVACLAFLALYYPREITTDETGVHCRRRLSSHKRLIRWDEIDSVRERSALYGIPAFDAPFIANWVLEIRPVTGARPIRFTCRHSGRRAFLQALKRWGAPEPVLRQKVEQAA